LLSREYYYHYGDKIVSGVPERKKRYPVIKSRKNIEDEEKEKRQQQQQGGNYILAGQKEQPRLTTADGYGSNGAPISGAGRVHMSSWGGRKRSDIGKSITEREIERKRREVTQEFGENCRALRERNDVHIVSWSEEIPE
jgi:hypothetical protein